MTIKETGSLPATVKWYTYSAMNVYVIYSDDLYVKDRQYEHFTEIMEVTSGQAFSLYLNYFMGFL